MGLNGSIEGSNPSFSVSAAPAAALRPPAEGWQSGRMRRSRKPLSVVRRIEGSNPSPSAWTSRNLSVSRGFGLSCGPPQTVRHSVGIRLKPLRTGARWRNTGAHLGSKAWAKPNFGRRGRRANSQSSARRTLRIDGGDEYADLDELRVELGLTAGEVFAAVGALANASPPYLDVELRNGWDGVRSPGRIDSVYE